MGCTNGIIYSSANRSCCPNPEIVINESCENLVDVGDTAVTIFSTSNTNGVYASLTYLADSNNTSAASMVITNAGTPTTISIPAGTSITRVFPSITTVTLAASDTGETVDGRLCFKIFTRIYL